MDKKGPPIHKISSGIPRRLLKIKIMKCEYVKVSDIKFQQNLENSIYGIIQQGFIMNQHD